MADRYESYRMTAYGDTRRALADRGHVGRPPHADFGGSLRRHRHGDVFRPDLAPVSGHVRPVARDLYWWAPVGLLLRNRMPTIEFVRGSLVPTSLIIAERDAIVPARRSAPLRTAIRNLVFERTIDAGHNDLYDHPEFAAAMQGALARN